MKDCGYGEDTDNQICDEILCKCSNTYIKRKLLEEGRGLSLAKALEIAENCEKVDTQLAAMSPERKEVYPAVIRRVRETRRGSGKKNQSRDPHKDLEPTCYRCGRTGHFGRDPVCPARGKFYGNVEWRDISKSDARQSRKVAQNKQKSDITGIPRKVHVLQTWSMSRIMKALLCTPLQWTIRSKKRLKSLLEVAS